MPPRDYKSNTYRTGKPQKKPSMDSWDRVLIVVFVTVLALVVKHFIVIELEKRKARPTETAVVDTKTEEKVVTATAAATAAANEVAAAGGLSAEELNAEPNSSPKLPIAKAPPVSIPPPAHQDSVPVEPHFDFYTILPSVDVVIPDHEIKTLIREEKIGLGDKTAKYIMQAGSFRDSPDAEKLKAKLTAIGVESRVEKAQVGEVMWYRVKVGPFSGMTSAMTVKEQLRSNGVDALVLEYK